MRLAVFLKAKTAEKTTTGVTYADLSDTGKKTFGMLMTDYDGKLAQRLVKIAAGKHTLNGTGQQVLLTAGLITEDKPGHFSATVLGKNIAKAFQNQHSVQTTKDLVPFKASIGWGKEAAINAANDKGMQDELVAWVDGGKSGGVSMGLIHAGWVSDDNAAGQKLTAVGASAYEKMSGKPAPKKSKTELTAKFHKWYYDKSGKVPHDPAFEKKGWTETLSNGKHKTTGLGGEILDDENLKNEADLVNKKKPKEGAAPGHYVKLTESLAAAGIKADHYIGLAMINQNPDNVADVPPDVLKKLYDLGLVSDDYMVAGHPAGVTSKGNTALMLQSIGGIVSKKSPVSSNPVQYALKMKFVNYVVTGKGYDPLYETNGWVKKYSKEGKPQITGSGMKLYEFETGADKPGAKQSMPSSVSGHFEAIFTDSKDINQKKGHDHKDENFLVLEDMGMVAWNDYNNAWVFTNKGDAALKLWSKNWSKPESSIDSNESLKAAKAQLIPIKMWVKRKDGKTFQQTFWVNPSDPNPPWDVHSKAEMHNEESKAMDYETHVDRITDFLLVHKQISKDPHQGKVIENDIDFAVKLGEKSYEELSNNNMESVADTLEELRVMQGLGLIENDDDEWKATELALDVIENAKKKGAAILEKQAAEEAADMTDFIAKYAKKGKLNALVSMVDDLKGKNKYLALSGISYGDSVLQPLIELGIAEATGEGDGYDFDSQQCKKFLKLANPALTALDTETVDKTWAHAKKMVDESKLVSDYMGTQCELNNVSFEEVPRAEWPADAYIKVNNPNDDGINYKLKIDNSAIGGFVKVAGIQFCIHSILSPATHKYDPGLKITEVSTGLSGGTSFVDIGQHVLPSEMTGNILSYAKDGKLAGLVKQHSLEKDGSGDVASLWDLGGGLITFTAENLDIESSNLNEAEWKDQLNLIEGDPPENDEDEDGGGEGSSDWDGLPFDVNGVTFDREVLNELDMWAGSPEMCKKVRSAMIAEVDGLPLPARYEVRVGHNGLRVAKMFDAHVHVLREKKLWRSTDKVDWLDMKPGDFTPLGISSFTRVQDASNIAQYSSVGGSIRIEVQPTKGGKLRGISIADIAEENEDWKLSTDNVHRYTSEQEVLLRAKALKVVSVDKAKRKVVCIAYMGKIPKGVVMKSKDVRPPVMHWSVLDDLSRPLSPRKKKAKGKKRGRK